MITKELLDFLSKEKATGRTNEEIKSVLVQNGWLASDVEEGFRAVNVPEGIPQAPAAAPFSSPVSPVITTMPRKGRRALLFIILLLIFSGVAYFLFFA